MNNFFEILAVIIIAIIIYLGINFFKKLSTKTKTLIVITFCVAFVLAMWLLPSNSNIYVRSVVSFFTVVIIIQKAVNYFKIQKT